MILARPGRSAELAPGVWLRTPRQKEVFCVLPQISLITPFMTITFSLANEGATNSITSRIEAWKKLLLKETIVCFFVSCKTVWIVIAIGRPLFDKIKRESYLWRKASKYFDTYAFMPLASGISQFTFESALHFYF